MSDQQQPDSVEQLMPFAAQLGLQIEQSSPEAVTATAEWAAERCTVGGVLHGGYLMALADSVGAIAAVHHLPEGGATSTIESKTNFFRPVTTGTVHISATIVHAGKRTIAVQTDITNPAGKLVTRTFQTQVVLAGQT